MNIIVTCAGHSRRFKAAGYTQPKFMLKAGAHTMIEHVVSMFNKEDSFYFIINEEQDLEFPNLQVYLSGLAERVSVKVIPQHELGPAYSALAADVPDGEPLLITYCDFFVEWDYSAFLQRCRDVEGGLVTFTGFHPASYGDTLYAYVRHREGKLLELREKESFTSDRTQEHANAGIYYFASGSLFKRYAGRLFETGFGNLNEAYVSLLYPLMLKDGAEVVIFEAKKFICLGTPEDLELYQFWWSYFTERRETSNDVTVDLSLIPMAGRGLRFRQKGYEKQKPLISIDDEPMAVAAARSFPLAKRWIFLPRQEDIDQNPRLESQLKELGRTVDIIPIGELTEGPADTCLRARDYFSRDESLFIASCDYRTVYDNNKWRSFVEDPSIDVAIWVTKLKNNLTKDPNAFAYCKGVGNGSLEVASVVEKKTISETPLNDPMVVGSFWYRRSSDFVAGVEAMIKKNIRVNGEFYVGTSINELIRLGKKVVMFEITAWISFGDPFELQIYQYWKEHFGANPPIALGTSNKLHLARSEFPPEFP